MAARMWRLIGLSTHGRGDLELSELHLMGSGARVDASATLSCSHAPIMGSLDALRDELPTVCRFAAAAVRSAGFALVWDFGVGNAVNVSGPRIGAGAGVGEFLAACTLQSSADGHLWVTARTFGQWVFPGAFAWVDASGGGDLLWDSVAALMPFDEALGSTIFSDKSPNHLALTRASAAPVIATAPGFPTGRALRLDGSGSAWVTFPNVPAVRLGSADFTVEAALRPDVSSGFHGVLGDWLINGQGNWRFYCAGDTIGFALGSNASFSTTFVAGEVLRMAVVKKGTRYTLFRNGVPVATMVDAWVPTQYNYPVVIGTNESYDPVNFIGMVGELRITRAARYEDAYDVQTDSFPAAPSAAFEPDSIQTPVDRPHWVGTGPVAAHAAAQPSCARLARDVEHGGGGRIWGTTKTKGTAANVPTKARVVLLHQRSKLPVRQVWSDAETGAFEFRGIDTRQEFLAVAEDAAGNFRPVAASRLLPEFA